MTYARHESPSRPVAQWLERPTGVRKVMGSIPVGATDFFFVPRSRHVDYSIFSYFITVTDVICIITVKKHAEIMQDVYSNVLFYLSTRTIMIIL